MRDRTPFGTRHPLAARLTDRHVALAALALVLGILGTLEFTEAMALTHLAVVFWAVAAVATIDLVAVLARRLPDPPRRER